MCWASGDVSWWALYCRQSQLVAVEQSRGAVVVACWCGDKGRCAAERSSSQKSAEAATEQKRLARECVCSSPPPNHRLTRD